MIKMCMSDKVLEGAQRLLDNAEQIRSKMNLSGACLALDDVYEVWDSGFISIPYDFSIHELPQTMLQLQSGQVPSAAAYAAPPVAPAASAPEPVPLRRPGAHRPTAPVNSDPRGKKKKRNAKVAALPQRSVGFPSACAAAVAGPLRPEVCSRAAIACRRVDRVYSAAMHRAGCMAKSAAPRAFW